MKPCALKEVKGTGFIDRTYSAPLISQENRFSSLGCEKNGKFKKKVN